MENTLTLPYALTKQIIQRAGGNPFFIEEVVRSLFDQGAIVRREGRLEVTEKVNKIPLPNTINDLLMARIDRLEEKTRDLLKVASVIGRSFFYRILTDVASDVEDIPGKLSLLSDLQLLQAQERMGEVEYLFRHALAQEAAYESLLPPKRRELHLKVAHSIGKIFKESLHEFYGMLAYHYSRAEDPEKTEEFLIKAGEEALRSAASDEALHYYEDALRLYLKKRGPDADPEKVALLQKNIALALYNKGRFEEAIGYFDKALQYYWGPLPGNAVSALFKVLSASLRLLMALYLPSLKRKPIPTQKDAIVVELLYKKCFSLGIKDPKRYFFEFMYAYKEVSKFDLARLELGLEIFLGASALFTFSGVSFGLSRKILNSAKQEVQESDPKRSILYEYLDLWLNYFEGNWSNIRNWVEDLANKNLRIGEIFSAAQYLYWYGLLSIYRGSPDFAKSMVKELNEIVEVYDNDFARILKYELNTNLLMEYRRLKEAQSEVKQAIHFAQKAGLGIFLFDLFSYEVWINILMGDIEQAERSLQRANEIRPKENAAPVELISLFRSQLEYHLCRLKEAIRNGDQQGSIGFRRQAAKSSRRLLRVSRKAAQHRTESYKLTGVYYWLTNKQKKALKWWHKAVEEGERLGARLELSRAYFEIGKRLLEPNSKHSMLNGIKAEDYLERARMLFEEMDLPWDLDELSRVPRDERHSVPRPG
jgi:tetratricopeptide (TPR) repeat protein